MLRSPFHMSSDSTTFIFKASISARSFAIVSRSFDVDEEPAEDEDVFKMLFGLGIGLCLFEAWL